MRSSSATSDSALLSTLDDGLAALGIEFDPDRARSMLDYLRLLYRWNRAYNLTGVRDLRQMVHRHVLDSLSLLPWIAGDRLLDAGSGAGLPGMVVALARPELECTLLDSAAKKTRFLVQAVAELRVRNVKVVRTRLQDYRPRSRYATVVSRALAPVSDLWAMSAPLLEPGGRLLAMKGRYPAEEVRALREAGHRLDVEELAVPGVGCRHLVIVHLARTDV